MVCTGQSFDVRCSRLRYEALQADRDRSDLDHDKAKVVDQSHSRHDGLMVLLESLRREAHGCRKMDLLGGGMAVELDYERTWREAPRVRLKASRGMKSLVHLVGRGYHSEGCHW